ncbi:hypothetical protein B566_EDAN002691 [Ephemera danica]|nr:hypothetical protein B566_EDAN002691 [Ephemera danica]
MDSLRNYDESSNHSTSSQNSETSDHRSRREPKHPYGVVYFHTDEQIALENLGTLQIRLEDCVDGKEVTANWKNSGPHKATIIKVAKKEFELRDTLNKKLKELAEGKFILPGVDPIAVNTFNKQTPAAAGLKSIGQSKRGRPKGLSNAKRPSVDKDPYCLIDFLQPPVNSAPDVTKNGNVPSNPLRRDIQVLATPTGTIVEKTTVTTTPASLVAQSAQHPAKSNTEQSVLRKRQDSSESSGTSPKVAKVLKKVELASNSGVYVTNWFLREIQSDTFFEQERLAAEALKQAEFANEPVPEALKPKKRKILTTFADRQFKKIIQHVMENDLLKYTHSGRRGAEAVDRNIIHTVACKYVYIKNHGIVINIHYTMNIFYN